MITVRMAKSKLENQEGMNHLWICLHPIGDVDNARLQIILPPGLFRRHNLNNFHEINAGEIMIYESKVADHFFIEIFTQEPVECGRKTIAFTLSYHDKKGILNRMEHFVPIEIVEEDEMNDLSIDEEVVRKIKKLQQYNENKNNHYWKDYSASKVLNINPEQCSDLEKKYRIDGEGEVTGGISI